MTSCWLRMPCWASSAPARPASRSDSVLGAGDEHERGPVRVGELLDGRAVLRLLALQSGAGAEAARALRTCLQVARPGAGKIEQPQGVAGRRGVEQDVVVGVGLLRVDDQPRELIERGDLDGALAGQLLLDHAQLGLGNHAAIWPDHALAIRRRRRLRVKVHHLQPGHAWNGTRVGCHRSAEHVGEVGRRIGADEQHAPAGVGECHRDRASDRGLSHSALAGEEHKRRPPAAPVKPGGLRGEHDAGWAHRCHARPVWIARRVRAQTSSQKLTSVRNSAAPAHSIGVLCQVRASCSVAAV